MTTVYGHLGKTLGIFAYFTIDTRKEPISEVYTLLDDTVLVLIANPTGGYTRKVYKSHKTALKAAKNGAINYASTLFREVEYRYTV